MNEFGNKGGVYGDDGYLYQKMVAAYYLIVENIREIEYEGDGQDTTIVNENRDRRSREYIQVKEKTSGAFTFSDYYKKVFPQMWGTFDKALIEHEDKGIYCSLITNVAPETNLKIFMELCTEYREHSIYLSKFEENRNIKNIFTKMKKDKDPEKFFRFLHGAKMRCFLTSEYLETIIISHFKECKVKAPKAKLAEIILFISKNKQKTITRNQIEEITESDLKPIKESSIASFDREANLKILYDFNNTITNFSIPDKLPSNHMIYSEKALPVQRVSNVHLSTIDYAGKTPIVPTVSNDELKQFIISERDEVFKLAKKRADLKEELGEVEKRLGNTTDSISSFNKHFIIYLGGNNDEN